MNARPTRSLLARVLPVLMVAPALLMGTTGSAHAAACSGSNGVTVIVDFAELGGGVVAGCAPAAKTAAAAFNEAGFGLEAVVSEPGMVCRVAGQPSDASCQNAPEASAFWSLWTAPVEGGRWNFAQMGAYDLRVPRNGYVAFAWHRGSAQAQPPAATATSRVPSTPTPRPTATDGGGPSVGSGPSTGHNSGSKPGSKPGSTGGGQKPTRGPSAPASMSVSADASTTAAPTPSASATSSATATSSTTPSADAASTGPTATSSTTGASGLPDANEITSGPETVPVADARTDDNGLPVWVPIVVVVALIGVAGAVAVRRRST